MKNIFIKKTIAAVLTSITLFGVLPIAASAETKTGWIYEHQSGKWYYYDDNGVMLKNTTTKDGYKLGADGAWVNDKNNAVSNANDTKGLWVLDKEKWYFKDENGVLLKNTTIISNGKQYKLDETGAVNQGGALSTEAGVLRDLEGATANVAATNGKWKFDEKDNRAYFVDDNGNRMTGWIAYSHRWYHLDKDGYKEINTTVDGYKLEETGAYIDGNPVDLTTTTNAHKNTDAYKATNNLWKKEGENWYLYSIMNEKLTGWHEDRGDWYYFDQNGVMQKNTTIKVGDKECKLGEDGAWCN